MRGNVCRVIVHFTVSKTEGKTSLDGCWGIKSELHPLVSVLSLSSREGHFFLWDCGEGRMVFFH